MDDEPAAVPTNVALDFGEFMLLSLGNKISFVPKYSDSHITIRFGSTYQGADSHVDVHRTTRRKGGGSYESLLRIPDALIPTLIEEMAAPLGLIAASLFRSFAPDWARRRRLCFLRGAVLDSPEALALMDRQKKRWALKPEAIEARIRVLKSIDEVLLMPQDEVLLVMSVKNRRRQIVLGHLHVVTDGVGGCGFWWVKHQDFGSAYAEISSLMRGLAMRHRLFAAEASDGTLGPDSG